MFLASWHCGLDTSFYIHYYIHYYIARFLFFCRTVMDQAPIVRTVRGTEIATKIQNRAEIWKPDPCVVPKVNRFIPKMDRERGRSVGGFLHEKRTHILSLISLQSQGLNYNPLHQHGHSFSKSARLFFSPQNCQFFSNWNPVIRLDRTT